jgi:signal recognition particle subunit SEC65
MRRWTCVYPIYLDAKRPYKNGERRIAKKDAVEWPLAKEMAEGAIRLGLKVFYEVRVFIRGNPTVLFTQLRVYSLLNSTRGIGITPGG